MGGVTIFAIVVLAVTSGDTALRSARLSIAEMFSIDQVNLVRRIVTCIPLVAVVSLLLWWSNQNAKSFNNLWNYFAWGNQMLSATTLTAATVWLVRQGRRFSALVTLVPGMFMTMVVTSFILRTPGTGGQPWGLVPGGLRLDIAVALSALVAVLVAVFVCIRARR
jgi:carbon starvation protein CstA